MSEAELWDAISREIEKMNYFYQRGKLDLARQASMRYGAYMTRLRRCHFF